MFKNTSAYFSLTFNGEFIEQLTKMPDSYPVTHPEKYKAISVTLWHFYLVICQIEVQINCCAKYFYENIT